MDEHVLCAPRRVGQARRVRAARGHGLERVRDERGREPVVPLLGRVPVPAQLLQHPDLSCLQAIALLVLSGRDAGSATLIASLLSAGLSIAQDTGLHRLITDEQWDAALKDRPARLRAQALVDREVKKRVVWALVHSEWFAIPFKGYSLLTRLQVATPLPLNATDECVTCPSPAFVETRG